MTIDLSVVVPVYNEEDSIRSTWTGLNEVLQSLGLSYEIIFVDDGSQDRSVEIIRSQEGAKLIQHPVNRGYGAALKTGIENANGEYILITDADGTYPHSEIPNLWKHAHTYDMVVGARVGNNVSIQLYQRPAKWFLRLLANYLSGTRIPDLNSGMRIFKRDEAKRYFNIICDGFSFTTTITLAYLARRLLIKYVPISYFPRVGYSKIKPLRDGLNFVLLIINATIYFNPLKVFLPIATIFILAGVLVFLYSAIILGAWYDSTIVLLLVAGIQIGLFGLLADLVVKRSD